MLCSGTSGDVKPVQTGLDQLEVLRLLDTEESIVVSQPMTGGQLLGLGEGRWYFRLQCPVKVNALFTGSY